MCERVSAVGNRAPDCAEHRKWCGVAWLQVVVVYGGGGVVDRVQQVQKEGGLVSSFVNHSTPAGSGVSSRRGTLDLLFYIIGVINNTTQQERTQHKRTENKQTNLSWWGPAFSLAPTMHTHQHAVTLVRYACYLMVPM